MKKQIILGGILVAFTFCGGASMAREPVGNIVIPRATNGLSAYELWLQQGNSGTLAQFLASLKGDPGVQGDPGARACAPVLTPETGTGTNAGCTRVKFQAMKGTSCGETDGSAAYSSWVCNGQNGTNGADACKTEITSETGTGNYAKCKRVKFQAKKGTSCDTNDGSATYSDWICDGQNGNDACKTEVTSETGSGANAGCTRTVYTPKTGSDCSGTGTVTYGAWVCNGQNGTNGADACKTEVTSETGTGANAGCTRTVYTPKTGSDCSGTGTVTHGAWVCSATPECPARIYADAKDTDGCVATKSMKQVWSTASSQCIDKSGETAVTLSTVCDGPQGPAGDVCDDVAAADKANVIKREKKTYTAPTGGGANAYATAVGYMTVVRETCATSNNTTTVTEYDSCIEVQAETSNMPSATCAGTVSKCTRADSGSAYWYCATNQCLTSSSAYTAPADMSNNTVSNDPNYSGTIYLAEGKTTRTEKNGCGTSATQKQIITPDKCDDPEIKAVSGTDYTYRNCTNATTGATYKVRKPVTNTVYKTLADTKKAADDLDDTINNASTGLAKLVADAVSDAADAKSDARDAMDAVGTKGSGNTASTGLYADVEAAAKAAADAQDTADGALKATDFTTTANTWLTSGNASIPVTEGTSRQVTLDLQDMVIALTNRVQGLCGTQACSSDTACQNMCGNTNDGFPTQEVSKR